MSTERRRYLRAVWGSVVVLSLVAAVFGALSVLSGPRQTSAQVDPSAVTLLARQRLVFDANQRIAAVTPEQVTVRPAASVTLSADADLLTVSFDHPLRYATEYTVTVDAVASASTGRSSTFSHTFTTGDPQLAYLLRNGGQAVTEGAVQTQPDRVLATTSASAEAQPILEAPFIQEYALLPGGDVLANTVIGDGVDAVVLAAPEALPQQVTMPGTGRVSDLQADPGQRRAGFRFTGTTLSGEEVQDRLYVFDGTRGTADPVLGLDGLPVSALDWAFLPGRNALVVRVYDSSLLVISLDGQSPIVPLGQFTGLAAVSPDGARLGVTTGTETLVLHLGDGTTEPVPLPPPSDSASRVYGGPLSFDGTGAGWYRIVTEASAEGRSEQWVMHDPGDGSPPLELYRAAADREVLVDLSVSPNGQYAAVTTEPAQGRLLDGYPVNARATAATTLLVDTVTGGTARSVAGFDLVWPVG